MEKRTLNRRDFLRLTAAAAAGAVMAACAPAAPQVIEVVKEVPVEKVVKETVVVEKEVPVEKVVKETVVVEKPAKPGKVVELEVMWRTDPGETKALEGVIRIWEEERPDVLLKPIYVPWDEFEPKLMTLYAGGIAPDIIGLGGTNPYAERFVRGMVLAMEPYLDTEPELAEDLFPVTIKTLTLGGHLYALPATICGSGTYYNATLFDEAGVEYPPVEWKGSAWTWDDMIETAKKLTLDKDGDGKIDQYGLNPGHASPWYYTRLWGEDLISEDDYASGILHKWQTDDPDVYNACVAGLQARADAIYKHEVTPTPETAQALRQMGPMLKTGVVAMEFTGAWGINPPLPEKFKFGAAANPIGMPSKGKGTRGRQEQVDVLQIPDQTDNPDAAWEFSKYYVMDKKAIRIRVKDIPYLPSLQSALPIWLDEYSGNLEAISRADLEKTIMEGMEVAAEEEPFRGTGCPCSHVVGWAAIRDIFNAELDPVWTGEKSAEEAVDTMIPLVNEGVQKHLKKLGLE